MIHEAQGVKDNLDRATWQLFVTFFSRRVIFSSAESVYSSTSALR
jgi:hypothetical protein